MVNFFLTVALSSIVMMQRAILLSVDYNSVHVPENGTGSFRFLNVFELVCRSEYLEKQKQADQNPTDLLLIQLNEK